MCVVHCVVYMCLHVELRTWKLNVQGKKERKRVIKRHIIHSNYIPREQNENQLCNIWILLLITAIATIPTASTVLGLVLSSQTIVFGFHVPSLVAFNFFIYLRATVLAPIPSRQSWNREEANKKGTTSTADRITCGHDHINTHSD